VIASNIGGQSEKVTDGVNGLHFRRGDPADLARVMRMAAETPGLWDDLHSGIPERPGHPIEEHVETITRIYDSLLAGSRVSGGEERRSA
jgi:glycosyltransferase involved in cell wall biosynthesis